MTRITSCVAFEKFSPLTSQPKKSISGSIYPAKISGNLMQFARLGSLSVCSMYFFGALFVIILLFRSRTPTSEGGEKG